ncbi:hypothetical protein GCM10012276_33270 [Nocardioides deserti]|nr:hypothetical protein GCM10012276_33270 [Nocardioides deserti]
MAEDLRHGAGRYADRTGTNADDHRRHQERRQPDDPRRRPGGLRPLGGVQVDHPHAHRRLPLLHIICNNGIGAGGGWSDGVLGWLLGWLRKTPWPPGLLPPANRPSASDPWVVAVEAAIREVCRGWRLLSGSRSRLVEEGR